MVNPVKKAILFVILLMLSPWASADSSTWEGPEITPEDAGLEPSFSTYDGFSVPTNATITDSVFEVAPVWVEAEDNGSYWAHDSSGGFNVGTSAGTSSMGFDGNLILQAQSTYGTMTDFESSVLQFSDWALQGDEIWWPIEAANATNGPNSSADGNFHAGPKVALPVNSSGILRSQTWDVPAVVNNFTLNFSRWYSLGSDDLSAIEVSFNHGVNWVEIENWSGQDENWVEESYTLDSMLANASGITVRFSTTSGSSGPDQGFFVDDFRLANDGEPLRSWFHGNASGGYSPMADGSLIIPVDLSGLTDPLELSYYSNWDIEADYADNMVVMISMDNGVTWTISSPLPGVPGLGFTIGGNHYTEQSYGWREVHHPLPAMTAIHQNASSALLKFRVTTDQVRNNGGSAIDGWEGIMIDDISVISSTATTTPTKILLDNLTSNTNHSLFIANTSVNEWQYIDWEGHNGPWSTSESFEINQEMPFGWRIDHERGNTPWEVGVIDNSNRIGPNSTTWPSGSKGMGVNLDGRYAHNTFTHLVSPAYTIPVNSTARLTFNHWICTEAEWDGGAIYTSIDDGITWQYYGDNITGFYERQSNVNTRSPFYNHGIFDGSTVSNGCGNNNSAQIFDIKSGDISYLSGNDVRIRFSFFSDSYVNDAGWYIDDAGIEIDRFIANGTWISPLIDVDEAGWGRLTGITMSPSETGLSVDVLDATGFIVPGFENKSLPLDLHIGAWEHSQLQFRVNMWTADEEVTPRLKILHHGMTEYITFDSDLDWSIAENLDRRGSDGFQNTGSIYQTAGMDIGLWRPFNAVKISCDGNASIGIMGMPQFEISSQGQGGQPQGYSYTAPCSDTIIEMNPSDAISINNYLSLIFNASEVIDSVVKVEPISLRAPIDPAIDFDSDGQPEWQWNGTWKHMTELYSARIDGVNHTPSDSRGFETTFSNTIELSVAMSTDMNLNRSLEWYDDRDGCFLVTVDGDWSCWNAQLERLEYSDEGWLSIYTVNKTLTDPMNPVMDFKLIGIRIASSVPHEFSINESILTSMIIPKNNGISEYNVTISAQRGGVTFNGTIDYEPAFVDNWLTLPSDTIYPGRTVSATSNHVVLEGQPAVEKVSLFLSPTPKISDSLIEIEVDLLDTGGRFIQKQGAAYASIDSSNSIWDGVNMTWSITGHWLFDDLPRLHWLVQAENELGVILGPAHGITGSGLNSAVTNDLEAVAFEVSDGFRMLSDATDPSWPMKVKANETLHVSGEVRFSGLANIHPNIDDVEINIELFAGNVVISTHATQIDENGIFDLDIVTPSDTDSGLNMTLRPVLTRVGTLDANSAIDVTAEYQNAEFILDNAASEVISLEVAAPGGPQPADGHVWYPGQDLPLRLTLSDDNGLPSSMNMVISKSNRDWEIIPFATPIGATNAVVDLPLIEESSIPISGMTEGDVRVYFLGYDLAGNPIENAGKSNAPLATIQYQNRHATFIDGGSLGMDNTDGFLYPGTHHTFNFTLSDENGIESIDTLRFSLDGDDENCEIEWMPWSGEVIGDSGCFIITPRVEATQRPLFSVWDVKIFFELRWDLEEDIGSGPFVPMLKLWDENAPLGAGFSAISPLEWDLHLGVELSIIDADDVNSPHGKLLDGILYIHGQDMVDFQLLVTHADTDIPAHNLPFSTEIEMDLIGDDHEELREGMNSDGTSEIRVIFDQVRFGSQVRVEVRLHGIDGHERTGDVVTVVIDNNNPTMSVSPGMLVSIDSDELYEVPVEITVHDQEGLDGSAVTMYWEYIRNGRVLEGAGGSDTINVIYYDSKTTMCGETLDISPIGIELQENDGLLFWFSGTDSSGRSLSGLGTSNTEPIQPVIRWIAYEPVLADIVTEPYRPEVGDIVEIAVLVQNDGVLGGTSYLSLTDGEGRLLGEYEVNLSQGESKGFNFAVEVWKTGDLGLVISLDGAHAPVPLADAETRGENAGSNEGKLLGLAFLSVFIAGMVLLIANRKHSLRMENPFEEE